MIGLWFYPRTGLAVCSKCKPYIRTFSLAACWTRCPLWNFQAKLSIWKHHFSCGTVIASCVCQIAGTSLSCRFGATEIFKFSMHLNSFLIVPRTFGALPLWNPDPIISVLFGRQFDSTTLRPSTWNSFFWWIIPSLGEGRFVIDEHHWPSYTEHRSSRSTNL